MTLRFLPQLGQLHRGNNAEYFSSRDVRASASMI
jgi:hypothetical protein